MSNFNLNDLASMSNLSISITSIHEENPKDAFIRRIKDITLFFIVILLIVCVFSFCCFVIISDNFNNDEKKWAMTLAGSIISGILGFITGKNTGA